MKLLELADAAAVIIIMAFLIMASTMRTYVLNGHESACVSCLTVAIQYVPITHAWRELGWGWGPLDFHIIEKKISHSYLFI